MVVRMRRNRSQTRMRRSHHGLVPAAVTACRNCGATKRPHTACKECGMYRGRQTLNISATKSRAAKRVTRKTKLLESVGKLKKS